MHGPLAMRSRPRRDSPPAAAGILSTTRRRRAAPRLRNGASMSTPETREPGPEFQDGLDWIHVERPLTLRHLRGKLVLLSLIHISEPTRLGMISYAVFCLKKKNTQ